MKIRTDNKIKLNTSKVHKRLDSKYSELGKLQISKRKYEYDPNSSDWKLDRHTEVRLDTLGKLMNEDDFLSFKLNLIYFANKYSPSYVNNIVKYTQSLLKKTKAKSITFSVLVNYKSALGKDREYRLGAINAFLCRWYKKYNGITKAAHDFLKSTTFKGNPKGEAVRLLDPNKGPLTDIEQENLHAQAYACYREGLINTEEISSVLITTHIGCRAVQTSDLRIQDLRQSQSLNEFNIPMYFLNVPRAKQRDIGFREEFKLKAITKELWDVLNLQANDVVDQVKGLFPTFPEEKRSDLPLFPNFDYIENIEKLSDLIDATQVDVLHKNSSELSSLVVDGISKLKVMSDRVEGKIHYNMRRSRYTKGTNLAREGYGKAIIAEDLDHSDDQNADVYTANCPEFIIKLDEAIGSSMIPIAQAFMGEIVDSEEDAVNGDKKSKRVRINVDPSVRDNAGTCGECTLCTENAPIACYTCALFQPWLNAPHQVVLEYLFAERIRIFELTGDERVASAQDRAIHAVLNVIDQCEKREEEINFAQKKESK
jgi:hypothetical protein